MMRIKLGVKVNGIKPEMILAYVVANDIYSEYEIECVITSCTDSSHSHASLHYVGYAIDLRTRDMGIQLETVITDRLQLALGDQYDVVLENDHIHVEYQPKEA